MSVRQVMDAVGSTPFFDLVEITEPKPNSLRLILAEMSVIMERKMSHRRFRERCLFATERKIELLR